MTTEERKARIVDILEDELYTDYEKADGDPLMPTADSMNAAAERLLALLEPEWISVKERLPENQQQVLAYEPLFNRVWCLGYINGNWYYGSIEMTAIEITHWQPLPDPPTR